MMWAYFSVGVNGSGLPTEMYTVHQCVGLIHVRFRCFLPVPLSLSTENHLLSYLFLI